ncbi:hypothetical protein D3C76_1629010 [compost metagenome]
MPVSAVPVANFAVCFAGFDVPRLEVVFVYSTLRLRIGVVARVDRLLLPVPVRNLLRSAHWIGETIERLA